MKKKSTTSILLGWLWNTVIKEQLANIKPLEYDYDIYMKVGKIHTKTDKGLFTRFEILYRNLDDISIKRLFIVVIFEE